MAGKKSPPGKKKSAFNTNPFSGLKGFSVSDVPTDEPSTFVASVAEDEEPPSFTAEMDRLGVKRAGEGFSKDEEPASEDESLELSASEELSDEELFLQEIGTLNVRFADNCPAEDLPVTASPRRMKQLRQGRLAPEATLDLHGTLRDEAIRKLEHFIADSRYQGFRTLLVVTGKGLHSSSGEAVLRNEIEKFLKTSPHKHISEWGRAPRQYGGDGALVLFLRSE